MKKTITILTLILLLTISTTAFAQDKPDLKVKFGGTIQAWGSYAQTDTDTALIGFGLRRVLLRTYADFTENLSGYFQISTAQKSDTVGVTGLTTFQLLDARIDYKINKNLKVKFGRFVGAGVRSASNTSHKKIDLVERAYSAKMWAKNTIGSDSRDYGVEIEAKTQKGFTGRFWIHNGNNKKNTQPSMTKLSTTQNTGLAWHAMGVFKPETVKGLEVGAHYGMGNKYYKKYTDYSAYAYYKNKQFRIKAEYISYELDAIKETSTGYYLFGAYKFLEKNELMARYEIFDQNTEADDDKDILITLGASHTLFKDSEYSAKVTGAYVLNQEETKDIDDNVFYVQFQFVF
ncbi:MAG: porin [Calditrichia bacterium]|nr:porin [Calditrichia bacterium]